MSAFRTSNPDRLNTALARGACVRKISGLVAIVFLMLQLLAPSLASAAKGDWIEICSEYGIVLQQVDLSEGERSPGPQHTDCEDCTFCAFAAPMSPPIGSEFELSSAYAGQTTRWVEPVDAQAQRYQWPESRGPPVRTQQKNAERNSRASQASPYQKGGALWT
ncbi:Protein of unknown function [Shimia gijangensis]|uniref:DUF2946 domain-containing protein n=2 Tax=Shimia gijangensis TaxID=1470563 RepID=A0A1M6LQY3_9RHOB|nr:Protein of unknown function [Shimia gijangensis]